MSEYLVSHEPATGAELWRGRVSDVDTEIAAARAAWPGWAAKPFSYRTETLRRFVDRVKAEAEDFADLIARETGKPLWEARTEVESVCNRSEEHTSELQSLMRISYAVFCLKKKK